MTKYWISADRIFDGIRFYDNHAICCEAGMVLSLQNADNQPHRSSLHVRGIVLPGFFDIQVNGGSGIQFNSSPTPEGISQIAKAHRALGTVALMPTVITDTKEVLAQAVEAAIAARDIPGVVGLHIEGPHLSIARKGTHDARFIRRMDERTINHVRQLRDAGLKVLITVAPENTSNSQIALLSEMGAVVSLGHSDADARTAADAVAAGATCFTHLFNAMSPMLNRAPGVTGTAISSEVWCSIIADGKHVDPTMVTLAARARPVRNRMIAISDAMATVGGPDHFDLYGKTIRVKDGRLINSEGSLAGAHITMAEAAKNLISYGIAPEEAFGMCRHNPAQLLGLWDDMQLIGTRTQDLVALDDDYNLKQVGIGPKLSTTTKVPGSFV